MSSPHPDAPRPPDDGPAPTKWPRWRQSMLLGALILLGAAIADAALDLPRAFYFAVFFVGYVFLSYGFFLAMNAKRDQANKRGATPRDRG